MAGTTPFGTAGDFTDAANALKILKDNGAPTGDAHLILNTTAGAKLIGLQSRADIQGGDNMLRQGVLLQHAGLNTLSSGFNPASGIAGFGGNFLANSIFGGDRGIGATIGGSLGGIGGTMAGTAIAASSGVAAGSMLGMAAGPLGALAGAFIGNAIGGLFGNNKPSDKTQSSIVNLNTGTQEMGGFTGKKFSQENADAAAALATTAKAIADIFGGIKTSVGVTVGSRDGYRLEFANAESKGYDTVGALVEGMVKGIAERSKDVSDSLMTAVENIDFTNVEQALLDLQFAANFDTLGEVPEVVSAVELALKEMNRQFDLAAETARRLGLSEKVVADARKKQLETMRNDAVNGARDSLLGNIVGGYSDFLSLQNEYNAAIKDFKTLGADTTLLTRNYQVQVQRLIAQNMESQVTLLEQEQERYSLATSLAGRYATIDRSFENLLYQMEYGQFSQNAPVQRLDDMRALVESIGREAMLGNADAGEKLAQVLPDFLTLSEEVNGANALFAQDLALGKQYASAAQTVAQRQLTVQEQIANAAQEQIALLRQMANGGGLAGMNDNYFSGDYTNARDSAMGSSDPFSTLSRARDAGAISSAQMEALTRSAGFYGTAGAGRAYQFFQDNTSAASQLARLLQQAGLQGYANGGLITGGVPGKDSVPIMAMGEEFMMRRSAVRSIGVPALEHMNRTGQLPASESDNGLRTEMQEMRAELRHITNIMAQGFEKVAAPAERTAAATENMASSRDLAVFS